MTSAPWSPHQSNTGPPPGAELHRLLEVRRPQLQRRSRKVGRGTPLNATARKGHRGDCQQRWVCNGNQHTCRGSRRLCLAPSGLDFSSLLDYSLSLPSLLISIHPPLPFLPSFLLSLLLFLSFILLSIPPSFLFPSFSPCLHSLPIMRSPREKLPQRQGETWA